MQGWWQCTHHCNGDDDDQDDDNDDGSAREYSENGGLAHWDGRLAVRESCKRAASAMTSAAMASTIGTALGTTHGSCLPSASSTVLRPSKSLCHCLVGWLGCTK